MIMTGRVEWDCWAGGCVDDLGVDDVNSVETYAQFVQQMTGIPYPSKKDMAAARKVTTDLFALYPHLTWKDLIQIAVWARAKKKRFPGVARLVNSWRYAYADGFLRLDVQQVETDVEEEITRALEIETNPVWRQRLVAAEGRKARREVLEAWQRVAVA